MLLKNLSIQGGKGFCRLDLTIVWAADRCVLLYSEQDISKA